MAEAGPGKIEIFEDFIGVGDSVALTAVNDTRRVGPFRVVGQGLAEADSGAPALDVLSGAVRLTTTNEDAHSLGLETDVIFDVGLMGTLVAEARVQLANFTTKEAFMGFTDIAIASQVPDLETDLISGSGTTITLTASDLVGFFLDSELTEDERWHMVYNGGTTTGETTSSNVETSADAVAGEWDVLRVEVDTNGTARWFFNGSLEQTVTGAVSTTTDLKFFIGVGANAATIATMDVDYIKIVANRDWTR